MPFDPYAWQRRIKAVEREHSAARLAVEHLSMQARTDPSLLQSDLRYRDLKQTSDLLEGTYIVRLFAEFETALRQFWRAIKTSNPPNKMHDLMQSLASKCKIGFDQLRLAHDVREYRNVLVHEREKDMEPIPIGTARSRLCTFLSRLR
jgi:hypothetical protein